MRTPVLILLGSTACDDTLFARDAVVIDGSGYTAVVDVFAAECWACHGAGSTTGGLDLETDPCGAVVDVEAANYSGARVVPGDSANSVVWNKIADTGLFGGVMPPGGAMSQDNIDIIAAWIDAGADCTEDTGS